MRKIRYGLDIDGVLYRWSDTARYLLETHWNQNPGESMDWDWIKNHTSPEAWAWLWTDGVTQHGLFRYGSLFKGAREFLLKTEPLCDNVVITSRPPAAVRDTMDWLSYQRVPTSEIHVVGNSQKKSQVSPHCDAYIDDAIHNAQDLMENTSAIVIMPDRPWNQGYNPDDYTRFHRTYSWEHVESILEALHRQINAE